MAQTTDSGNADQRRSLTAADSLTVSTKQGEWGERVMVLRPFKDFWDKMAPALLAMLAPRGSRDLLTAEEMRKAMRSMAELNVPTGELLEALCGIAEWMIDIKNDLALQATSIPEIRRLAKSFDSRLKAVRESKKLLTTVSTIATLELAPCVNGGLPEFAQTFNALERLESRLSKLRNAVAATIPPKERKPKERRLAPLSLWKAAHELAAFAKPIRSLDYSVVYLIDRELTKFNRLDHVDIRSHLIDRFMARFFYVANNRDVEETPRRPPSRVNVKMMRHRLRSSCASVVHYSTCAFQPMGR
jgi:hypothetical protein